MFQVEHSEGRTSTASAVMREVSTDGYAVVRRLLSNSEISSLRHWSCDANGRKLTRNGVVFAIRNILQDPVIQNLARKTAIKEIVAELIGPKCVAVNATLFDKVAGANWLVPYHQDRTAAVRERRETPGFGPWSIKCGLLNVQLPSEILDDMIAVRVHLDDCPEENGALRVLPKSHRGGSLTATEIARVKTSTPERACVTCKGDALIMRPLLLHASSASKSGRSRRVIHIEYAGRDLPNGLEWLYGVG